MYAFPHPRQANVQDGTDVKEVRRPIFMAVPEGEKQYQDFSSDFPATPSCDALWWAGRGNSLILNAPSQASFTCFTKLLPTRQHSRRGIDTGRAAWLNGRRQHIQSRPRERPRQPSETPRWIRHDAGMRPQEGDKVPTHDARALPRSRVARMAGCAPDTRRTPAIRPADDVLTAARSAFEAYGLRVAFNKPYGNATLPDGWRGPSMLVELNKATYLDERTLGLLPDARRVIDALRSLDDVLLDTVDGNSRS